LSLQFEASAFGESLFHDPMGSTRGTCRAAPQDRTCRSCSCTVEQAPEKSCAAARRVSEQPASVSVFSGAVAQPFDSGPPLMVSKSVVLELEWVTRGYYGFSQAEVASALRHLLDQPHVVIEDRSCVEQALLSCQAGIEFADALHHASYQSCDSVATFDDRKFARRANKIGLTPRLTVLS
jgi:predicted nucleic-acid-binding protein